MDELMRQCTVPTLEDKTSGTYSLPVIVLGLALCPFGPLSLAGQEMGVCQRMVSAHLPPWVLARVWCFMRVDGESREAVGGL